MRKNGLIQVEEHGKLVIKVIERMIQVQVFFFCFFRALDGLVLHLDTVILLFWLLGLL